MTANIMSSQAMEESIASDSMSHASNKSKYKNTFRYDDCIRMETSRHDHAVLARSQEAYYPAKSGMRKSMTCGRHADRYLKQLPCLGHASINAQTKTTEICLVRGRVVCHTLTPVIQGMLHRCDDVSNQYHNSGCLASRK